jgi:pyridoxine 4-dehydrogenase
MMRQGRRDMIERIQPLIELQREIGAAHGDKTPAQVALNWTLSKGVVALAGAKNGRQAMENSGALGWTLSSKEIILLNSASEAVQIAYPR